MFLTELFHHVNIEKYNVCQSLPYINNETLLAQKWREILMRLKDSSCTHTRGRMRKTVSHDNFIQFPYLNRLNIEYGRENK